MDILSFAGVKGAMDMITGVPQIAVQAISARVTATIMAVATMTMTMAGFGGH